MHSTLRRPLLILSLLTLGLTTIRLIGELAEGPAWLFARDAGGGGALLGIGWLIPIAGIWFARRLAAVGHLPAQRRRSILLAGAGVGGIAVVFVLAQAVFGVSFGTFFFVMLSLPLLSVLAFRAWPELARALLAYALAARLPVVVLTMVAVANAWGTHYERLAPGSTEMSAVARTAVLCIAQICLWVPLTVLVGCLAGLVVLPRRAAPTGAPDV